MSGFLTALFVGVPVYVGGCVLVVILLRRAEMRRADRRLAFLTAKGVAELAADRAAGIDYPLPKDRRVA